MMDPKTEVESLKKMLEGSGFKVVDTQFEGVIEAQDSRVIAVINKMSESGQAFGVLRVFYDVEGDARVIEVPVGNMPPEEEMPIEEEPPPPQPKGRR